MVEGELIRSPAPNLFHQTIAGKIYRLIANFLEGNSTGSVFIAPCDVRLSPHDVVQPDVFFVAQARLGRGSVQAVSGNLRCLIVALVLPALNVSRERAGSDGQKILARRD
ncbi:MAG: Uma2 family endonuclease [Opitutae bacterium]|nr:Uma2 family endonuclease [Opitutae bacterium]